MPTESGDRRGRSQAVSHPDLVAVVVLAVGAVGVVVGPVPAPVRAVVGLAFLLVAPGYATTVALFPAASGPATPTRLERFGLTIIGSAVLAGTLAISYTMAGLPLTPVTAVGGLVGWTLVTAGIGAWRRPRPADGRIGQRAIPGRARAALGQVRGSRLAVAFLALAIVGAGVAGALVAVDFRSDPYTEVGFVEGPRVSPDGTLSATVEVRNYEGRAVRYTVVTVRQRAVRTSDGVRVRAARRLLRTERRLAAGERWRLSVAGPAGAATRVVVRLYAGTPVDGPPEAHLHAWLPSNGTATRT